MSTTDQFEVEGMTCGGCERALSRAVSRLPGVETVVASHAARLVTVTYDDAHATRAAIAEAIREAGYTPVGQDQRPPG